MSKLLNISLVLLMCQKGLSLPLATHRPGEISGNCSCGAQYPCTYWDTYFFSVGTHHSRKCKELVEELGCDCSYCHRVSFCDCDLPKSPPGASCDTGQGEGEAEKDTLTSTSTKMKGGSSCIPRCPIGTVAS